jgi:hypothetical protein
VFFTCALSVAISGGYHPFDPFRHLLGRNASIVKAVSTEVFFTCALSVAISVRCARYRYVLMAADMTLP